MLCLLKLFLYLHHCLLHHHILIPAQLNNLHQSNQLDIGMTKLDLDFPSVLANNIHFHCRPLDNCQECNVFLPILDYSGTCSGYMYHGVSILDHKTCTDTGLPPSLPDTHIYLLHSQNGLHIPHHNMLKKNIFSNSIKSVSGIYLVQQ